MAVDAALRPAEQNNDGQITLLYELDLAIIVLLSRPKSGVYCHSVADPLEMPVLWDDLEDQS